MWLKSKRVPKHGERAMPELEGSADVSVEFKPGQDPAEAEILAQGFHEVLANQLGSDRREPFSLVLKTKDGRVAGGLLGKLLFGDLHIDVAWLEQALRGRGYARELLRRAEAHGYREGCGRAVLNTMRPGVVRFCQRMGYREVGRIENFAMGHAVHFMMKDLKPDH